MHPLLVKNCLAKWSIIMGTTYSMRLSPSVPPSHYQSKWKSKSKGIKNSGYVFCSLCRFLVICLTKFPWENQAKQSMLSVSEAKLEDWDIAEGILLSTKYTWAHPASWPLVHGLDFFTALQKSHTFRHEVNEKKLPELLMTKEQ